MEAEEVLRAEHSSANRQSYKVASQTATRNYSRPMRSSEMPSNYVNHASTSLQDHLMPDSSQMPANVELQRSLSVSTDGHSRPGSPSSMISSASSHINPASVPAPYHYHSHSSVDNDRSYDFVDNLEGVHANETVIPEKRDSRWKSFFNHRSRDSTDTAKSHNEKQIHTGSESKTPEIRFSPASGILASSLPDSANKFENLRQEHARAADRVSRLEEEAHFIAQLELNEQQARKRTMQAEADRQLHQQQELLHDPSDPVRQHTKTPSVYSNYSYYGVPPDSPTREITASLRSQSPVTVKKVGGPDDASLLQAPGPIGTFAKSTKAARAQASDVTIIISENTSDSNDFLLLGIQEHEAGNLERATAYFQKAAQTGSGHGCLLFGLSLRHGWGVAASPENAERGFTWLQKAAETVVADLDQAVMDGSLSGNEQEQAAQAARHELVLAIYELGMCFRRGWGVKKDKQLAISYFELAAKLGDADASQELGFMFLNGKGCKRNKKMAAHYYRLAEKQGSHLGFGMQWIHKDKYD